MFTKTKAAIYAVGMDEAAFVFLAPSLSFVDADGSTMKKVYSSLHVPSGECGKGHFCDDYFRLSCE